LKRLTTNIEINAPSDKVWNILVDFDAYPDWNPFITQIKGKAIEDERLEVTIHPPGGKEMTLKPVVLIADENKHFRWLGHLLIKGIFDGEHIFRIESTGNSAVRFVHEEVFRGLLVPLFSRMLDEKIRRGFESMNYALKERAEEYLHKKN
jgi:hypothetical protein